jgi:predicted RNA-binding Zn ribbon-like protein
VSADQRPQEFHFDLSGGHLALDFANSISRRDLAEKSVEHLKSYGDLISFARQARALSPDQAQVLQREAESHSRSALQAFRSAIALRESIFKAFLSLANRKPASLHDIDLIEKAAKDALGHRYIVRENGEYRWQWDDDLSLERIIWPIVQSAADLLTSPDLKKIRECEAGDCYWLFLDNSRNRSRRWCSMESCGNREKARRHYHRQRSNSQPFYRPTR